MKSLVIALVLATPTFAALETWTNKDGKEAKLEFIRLIEKDGEKAGEFKMANGKLAVIKASALSDADATRLSEMKNASEKAKENTADSSSNKDIFAKHAKKGLVKLEGSSVKPFVLSSPPKKYYVFYYSASWCGPCRQITPQLVKWYNDNKTDDFEFIHVSSDQDDTAMKKYMSDDKMPWPAFLHSVLKTEQKFGKYRTGNGIPRLSVVKSDGTIVISEHPGSVMGQLKELLAK